MKKIMMLAVAAMLVTGSVYADGGKKCAKGKGSCKKEASAKKEAKKEAKTDAKTAVSNKA